MRLRSLLLVERKNAVEKREREISKTLSTATGNKASTD